MKYSNLYKLEICDAVFRVLRLLRDIGETNLEDGEIDADSDKIDYLDEAECVQTLNNICSVICAEYKKCECPYIEFFDDKLDDIETAMMPLDDKGRNVLLSRAIRFAPVCQYVEFANAEFGRKAFDVLKKIYPHEEYADFSCMLDALEENYAKATFFCLGQNAGYYPETVQREYNLGMEVGTHTYSHVVLTSLSASALDSEISKSVDAINKAIGVKPSLMRPPYGAVNKTVLSAVGGYNLCCMNWSLDTEDWKTKNADATYNEVMKAQDGDVVLLHDIHEYNVDAVKRFVPDLIAEGFQLVTVPELYEARGETLEAGTVHYRTDPTTQAGTETAPAASTDSAAESTTASE